MEFSKLRWLYSPSTALPCAKEAVHVQGERIELSQGQGWGAMSDTSSWFLPETS